MGPRRLSRKLSRRRRAEIDLILEIPGKGLWAIEIKRGLAPKMEKGFHLACADLQPSRRFLVYSGKERFPAGSQVEAISPVELSALISAG